MHLIQLLVFFASYHHFWFYAAHVAGKDNSRADSLSRNNILFFLSQVPSTSPPAIINPFIINHSGSSKSHMDIHQLDEALWQYFAEPLTSSTHKTCATAEHWYLNFCRYFSLVPLPVSESTLCYFMACLGQHGLAQSSISTYLSGIRQVQISHGFCDPHSSTKF